MAGSSTPRVLRLSFQIHIPRGVETNIRQSTIDRAFDTLAGAVRALAPTVLPWADRIIVRREWLYDWTDETDEFQLPVTDKNTVRDLHDDAGETAPSAEHRAA